MMKGLIIFGAGLYAGVYIAQNYQIDKVESPTVLMDKVQTFISEKFDIGDANSKKDDGKKGK